MTKHKVSLLLLVSFLVQLSFASQAGSSVLDKKISLQVNNQPLHAVLHQIERMAGVSFAYMSGLIDKNKIVSISVNQVTMKVALQKLITNPDVRLYVLDNQIIFYQKDAPPPASNGTTVSLQAVIPKIEPPQKSEIKHDFIIDTQYVVITDTQRIITHDTIRIKHVDSIKIFDTLHIKPITDGKITTRGWFIDVWGGFTPAQTTKNQAIEPYLLSDKTLYSINAGVNLQYTIRNLYFSIGVGVEQKHWDAQYQFQKSATNYKNIISYKDSISWEYFVFDTIYKGSITEYHSDSIKIINKTPVYKQDTITVDYSHKNVAYYVTIPLQISYNFPISKHLEIYPKFGVQFHLLTASSGKTLLNTNTTKLLDLREALNTLYLSTNISLSVYYKLSDRHSIGIEGGVKTQISEIYRYSNSTGNIFFPFSIHYGFTL